MNISQALAESARQCGVRLITHVPGYGASETFAACGDWPLSYHEEVAFGLAQGSALTGHPALCLIKMHGLLKASNALVCALSMGVRAGFLTVIFDDKTGSHSDNQLPTRALLEALEVPMDVCERPEAAPAALAGGLRRSQEQGLPRVLLLDSDAVTGEILADRWGSPLPPAAWSPDPLGELVCPLFGAYQRGRLLHRLERQPDCPPPGTLPPIAGLPERWQPTMRDYRPWMEAAFRAGKPAFVAGDTGLSSLFGLEPDRLVDAIGWMGGSLPLALGALAGGHESAWAVTGDFSFLAAGCLGWQEALRRNLPLRVLLFDNGCARATGGQPVNRASLEALLGASERVVRVRRPEDLQVDRRSPGPILYWLETER